MFCAMLAVATLAVATFTWNARSVSFVGFLAVRQGLRRSALVVAVPAANTGSARLSHKVPWVTTFCAAVALVSRRPRPLLGGPRNAPKTRCADAVMPWRIPNTSQWQWLSVRELLLRERILMVSEYIDDRVANIYLAMLLYLQSEDPTKPVQLYFSVSGADLKPSLALYDTICELKAKGCPVTTVAYSLCQGVGALLAASGTQGRRYATQNALMMLTKTGLENPVQGPASDLRVEVAQMLKENARVEAELASITGQTREKIEKDLRRNFYLSAAEAVEYGLCDRVLQDAGPNGKEPTRDPWSGVLVNEQVGFGVFASERPPS